MKKPCNILLGLATENVEFNIQISEREIGIYIPVYKKFESVKLLTHTLQPASSCRFSQVVKRWTSAWFCDSRT